MRTDRIVRGVWYRFVFRPGEGVREHAHMHCA